MKTIGLIGGMSWESSAGGPGGGRRLRAAAASRGRHRGGRTGRGDRVGLLGTAFTMEQDFYRDRLAGHGLDVLTPDASQIL